MNKNFTTTIELDNKKLHLNTDDLIIETLKNLYVGTCFKKSYIREIKEIVMRGDVVFTRNIFPTVPQCDVIFSASVGEYNKGDYIALTITEITDTTIVCITDEYIASVDLKYIPKPQGKILAIIGNISYQRGYKISFIGIPYFRPKISFGTICKVPEFDKENFIESIDNIDIPSKLKLVEKKPVYDQYKNIKKSFDFDMYSYENYKNIEKYKNQEVILIIDCNYSINAFYVAKPEIDRKNIHVIYEACTVYNVIYKYFTKLASQLDAICNL